MNKLYAAFLIFLSYFLLVTFSPKNVDSASKQTATTNKISEMSENTETAILAGGCFWCMEHPYEDLPGVSKVISGYTGGEKKNPTYKEVASGSTMHVEAVEIHFNPAKISYNDILEIFWRNIDPTDAGGQFVDRGKQYTTGIYYKNEQQKQTAQESKKRIEDREYDIIKFRNGYAKDAPTMLVEYKGYTIGKEYELKLGKIIEVNYE